jgi:GTP cyclohydrolase I|tara:strand:- start:954 stop:1631 length:678 start_codon:yes stop_codon:yes gene_type:complete
MISDELRKRMKTIKHKHFANDTIYTYLDVGDLQEIENEVTDAFQGVLKALVINTDDDHNSKDTARRVAKMFVHEIFRGRYYPPPEVTAFPNAKKYDQIYMSGPMSINSTCAHHFQPITGKAYVGIFPGDKVIGLSKFNRMVDWVASRPQIQEEMTEQIADMIEKETEAKGVAVIIKAEHFCMTARGVKEHESDMLTSVVRGIFRTVPHVKAEFFSLLNNMKGLNE